MSLQNLKKHSTTVVLIAVIVFSLWTLIYRNYLHAPTKVPEIAEVTSDTLLQEVTKLEASIVLVNFWATWCDPCKEEIPVLLELEKKYTQQGLRVLFVSMDEPEDQKDVLQFVNNTPGMINLRKTLPGAKILRNLFSEWMGVIPVTILFSQTGDILEAIEGTRESQEFEKILQKYTKH